MAQVPRIDSPCPIAGKALPGGATEHCTLCDRTVHNLDRMSGQERMAFMRSCSGKVCVAYTVRMPVRRARLAAGSLAAVAAAAALVALPASAAPPSADVIRNGDDPAATAEPPAGAQSPIPGGAVKLPNCDDLEEMVMTGGVSRADHAEWTDDGQDAPPDLGTIEDDGR
jgi:hypothetical protein